MFICIARTKVDWEALLGNTSKALGRSITDSLDAGKLPLAGVPSFTCAVAEFASPGGNALDQLRHDFVSKKHSYFSFLVNLERCHFVTLASFDLSVTPADVGDFAIVSGRLSDWVQAVVNASQIKVLRLFACSMLSWFEIENLGEAWASWDKEHIAAERLFRLVKK